MPTREDAFNLLNENVASESLRRHCLAVAHAMEAYAKKNNQDSEKWFICGLLHDFDYEKFPNENNKVGVKILKEKGYDKEISQAILSHAVERTAVQRESIMDKCLFAVDELCGFLVALAKVRPDNFAGMDAKSVEKGLKKKGFAAAINREDIEKGVSELGTDREEHFNFVISALREHAKELGLSRTLL